MFGKRVQAILVTLLIAVMIFPNVPASALAPLPQQATIAYHDLTGMIRYMGSPADNRPIQESTALQQKQSSEEVARSFLSVYGEGFGVSNAYTDLSVMRETQSDVNGASTVRFQQTYRGIPILAGEMIVHMDARKNVLSASGEMLPNIQLDVTPSIDEATAIQTALEIAAKENGASVEDLQASAPELWIYNPALLTPYKGATVLAWRIEVTPKTGLAPVRQLVMVEAKRGGIALTFNQIDSAKNRLTYNANGNNVLPGTLVCNESNPACSGGTADAINAHLYAGQTYDFYMNNHGRDSINGAGMNIVSSVNFDDVPGGATYANAFWNGAQMVYGAGYASADDVVAHELTHGVTENEARLFYFWQSGAINESFSDVWGEFLDLTNGSGTDTAGTRWLMGEDLTIGAIRDMEDPTTYGDPDKMTSANYYTGTSDNGGVHWNSGVNNKAAFLMADGGTFNTRTVTALGITKTAKIYYYAQSNLLVSGSDYADLYYALQVSCAAQVGTAGITSADCVEVLDAVNAVEMNLQPVAGYNPDASVCDVAGRYPVNRFFDNLEAGSGNWATTTLVGTNRWSFDWPYTADYGIFSHSGSHFLYADDYPAASTDSSLRMVNSVLVPPSGKMIFHHAYVLETGYDGGVLEYSTNGGSTWSDAAPYIDANTYDGILSTGYSNPLGGRSAFTGISNGYISTRLNLSALAGQNVMFRFRLGLDTSGYGLGWWLDDVQIYECVRFSDVASNYWAYTYIDKLAANNITGGCATGLYCPTTGVTRAQMAIFLLRGMHGSAYIPPAATGTVFTDVSAGSFAAAWIERLAAEGITGGCGGTNYCPNQVVTRAQMAIFLLRAKHGAAYVPPPATGTLFTDVSAASFGAAWIEQLVAEGITTGCGGTNYCPSSPVNRDSMAVFLVRTFNLP
ncbi:MAG: M4 family metallopeptidase [Chloroflexi bacterium]|nr:M4 family metallopeptidase [Chloroflexota bacterium]